jgi:hypothetical protein
LIEDTRIWKINQGNQDKRHMFPLLIRADEAGIAKQEKISEEALKTFGFKEIRIDLCVPMIGIFRFL